MGCVVVEMVGDYYRVLFCKTHLFPDLSLQLSSLGFRGPAMCQAQMQVVLVARTVRNHVIFLLDEQNGLLTEIEQ